MYRHYAVLHKRRHPFITYLPDIDTYRDISLSDVQIQYPENTRRAQTVFDFEKFCRRSGYFLSQLFSGKSLEEISRDRKGEAEYYMAQGDEKVIFTSVVP